MFFRHPKPSKIELWRGLQGRLWGVLGRLGQSWRVLGTSGACLGCVLECQRASWRHVGAILGRLGSILARLGKILEGFGRVLEAFSDDFWCILMDFLPS